MNIFNKLLLEAFEQRIICATFMLILGRELPASRDFRIWLILHKKVNNYFAKMNPIDDELPELVPPDRHLNSFFLTNLLEEPNLDRPFLFH